MTRNSPLWWIGLGSAILTVIANQFGLLHVSHDWQDRIELIAAIVGTVSAFLRMSPLALSDDSALRGTSDHTKTLSILPPRD